MPEWNGFCTRMRGSDAEVMQGCMMADAVKGYPCALEDGSPTPAVTLNDLWEHFLTFEDTSFGEAHRLVLPALRRPLLHASTLMDAVTGGALVERLCGPYLDSGAALDAYHPLLGDFLLGAEVNGGLGKVVSMTPRIVDYFNDARVHLIADLMYNEDTQYDRLGRWQQRDALLVHTAEVFFDGIDRSTSYDSHVLKGYHAPSDPHVLISNGGWPHHAGMGAFGKGDWESLTGLTETFHRETEPCRGQVFAAPALADAAALIAKANPGTYHLLERAARSEDVPESYCREALEALRHAPVSPEGAYRGLHQQVLAALHHRVLSAQGGGNDAP